MPETTLFGDPVSSPGQAVPQPSSKATMFGDPVSDPASTQRTAFGDPILAPSMGAMTPQQIEEFQKQGYESQVKGVMNRYGVPEFVARGLLSGGKPVDVAISVGLPLAGQIAGAIGGAGAGTAVAPGPGTVAGGISGASAGGALGGAAATGLVQMREMARGERPEFGVGQAIGDIALGAFVPKPLAAAAEGASLASRLGQIALQRGKEGALLGAGAETLKQVIDPATAGQEELVRSVMQKYGQDEATARMLVSGGEIATAGTLGSLVGAGLGTALEGLAPTIWKKIFNRTPEQAAVILEQETQTPEVVNARKVLDDILGPVESRAPKGEEVQRNIDVMMGIPSASQAPSEGAQMVSAVEKELGLAGPEAAAKPFMRKAVDAATVLDEAMAAQDRKIANLAGRLEEDLVQNRLGMEEISPMTEMDRIRALDRRARDLAERPGEAAKEQARIAAERERLTAKLPEESPMATPEDIPPTPEMSAQAQRMMDEYGRAVPKTLQSVAGGGVGFVYGWNTGEGLPPEERLARAIEFGAGGALTPIAIRKVISLQGWANSVLKERGPGSGALNTADPEVIGALAVKGAAILDEGANSFADWSKKMVSRFGDEIRPMLKEVWATGERSQILPKEGVEGLPRGGWAFGDEKTIRFNRDRSSRNWLASQGELVAAASSQRDVPETAMYRVVKLNQEAGVPAVYNHLLEHVGDLSHRAQEPNQVGLSALGEKLQDFKKYLFPQKGRASLEQELENGFRSNAEYQVLQAHPELEVPGRPRWEAYEAIRSKYPQEVEANIQKAREALKANAVQYVEAHRESNKPVTYAGRLGRVAAIALGEQDFEKLRKTIVRLEDFYQKYKGSPEFYAREEEYAKASRGEYPKLNVQWEYPETVPFTPKAMQSKGMFERELKSSELVDLLPHTQESVDKTFGEMLSATAAEGAALKEKTPVVEVAWNDRKKVWQVIEGRGARTVEVLSSVNPTQELPVVFKAINVEPSEITAQMRSAPLVPQARPTELVEPTKRYWQEITRPTFRKFFGKSEVVDDLGNPKYMFHGTYSSEPFESTTGVFKPGGNGLIFFSPSPKFAEWYAGMRSGSNQAPEGARIIKAFVRAENPFNFENPEHIKKLFGQSEWAIGNSGNRVQKGLVEMGNWASIENLSQRIKALGFDGLYTMERPVGEATPIRNLAVFSPNQAKSSIANSGAYSLDNRDMGGFINRNLAIRAGSASSVFALAFAEGKDLPPEERLTRALIAAGAAGAIAPKLLSPMLKGINNVTTPPPAAVTGGPVTPKTLADVEKIFTARPEGTPPSFSEKLQSAWVKGVSTLQNRFRVMDELEKNLMGASAPKLTLGDRFSLVAGAAGKADAGIYEVEKAQKNLIPEISRNDLNSFLFLRRTFDRLNTMANDPTSGSRQVGNWTMPDVQKVMTDLHAKLGTDKMQRMEQFAQVLQKSADDDLQLMVRSGRLSPKDYLDIKSKNDFYAPFYVMDYFTQHEGAVPGIGRSIDTTKPFTQAIKGLEDEDFRLGDIVSAFNANKLRANILADKNEAMQQLAKLTQADPNGLLIRDLGPSAAGINAPKGFSTVNYMENGVQKKLAVSPQVANAVKGMDTQQLGLLATMASGPASALRAGATGLNASFQVVNQFKDAARFGLVSKYGLRSVADVYQLPLDLASAAVTSWKSNVFNNRDQLYQDYLKSGAARSTIASQLSPDSFSKLAQAPDQTSAAKYLGLPIKYFMDSTAKIGNAIEETVKLAGFKRGARMENLANLKGKDFEDALQQVAYEVRNYAGSPDFSKHGSVGKELNLLFMFANARMQGLAADMRRITGGTGKREGVEALMKVAAGVGLPTYYLWAMNQQPENISDFNSRPLTERNNYFLIPRYNKAGQPAYFTNEQGEKVREFWRFPKSELIGQVANTMEGALNYAKTKDPEAAKKAAVNLMENMSPISITGRNFTERMESVASGLNPLIKAPLEMASNRNLFAHRDIVPRNMVGASPEEQYRRTTPPGFISAAQAMPDFMPDRLRSPMQLQQLTSNLTAGLFTQFMRPEQEGRDPLVANPVLGRFFSAPYLDREEDWNAIDRFKTPSVDANLKRQRAIDDFLKKADSMPAQQKFDTMRQILAADPERNSQALLNAMKDKYVGTTDLDRYVRAMDAKSRAQYLEWKASTLPSQQERAMYYQTMASRGVLTKDVGEEIMKLRQAAPTTK